MIMKKLSNGRADDLLSRLANSSAKLVLFRPAASGQHELISVLYASCATLQFYRSGRKVDKMGMPLFPVVKGAPVTQLTVEGMAGEFGQW